MYKKEKILVIYHKGCWDGFGAAYAYWSFRQTAPSYILDESEVTYLAMNYDEPIPDFTGYSLVYILDYSFKLPVMREILSKYPYETINTHFVNIDHHEGALPLRKIKDRNFEFIYDGDQSGASLSWMEFYRNLYITRSNRYPLFIAYIRDRDLHRFELPESKAVNAYIRTHKQTFDNCIKLSNEIENDFDKIVEIGKIILVKILPGR